LSRGALDTRARRNSPDMSVLPGEPPEKSADMAVAAGIPVQTCNYTLPRLDELLKESGYGANQLMFGMYFRPNPAGSGPPLCAACGRIVAQHPNRAPEAGDAAPAAAPTALFSEQVTEVLVGAPKPRDNVCCGTEIPPTERVPVPLTYSNAYPWWLYFVKQSAVNREAFLCQLSTNHSPPTMSA